ARGHLAEAVDVVRLVRVNEGGAAKSREALVKAVLEEVNHRESGNRQRLVVLEAEGRSELLDREAEVARAQKGRAEQRVRARRHRVNRDDARRLIEGVLILSLLEERAAQAQTRLRVARVLREQIAVELFRDLEVAFAYGALGTPARAVARAPRRRACRACRADERRENSEGGHNADRRT